MYLELLYSSRNASVTSYQIEGQIIHICLIAGHHRHIFGQHDLFIAQNFNLLIYGIPNLEKDNFRLSKELLTKILGKDTMKVLSYSFH
jgi:hypothetical protein